MAANGIPPTSHDQLLEAIKDLQEINDGDKTTGGRYLESLILVAGMMPLFLIASLVTVIVYLSPSPLPQPNPSSPSPLSIVEFLGSIGVLAFLSWLGPAKAICIIGLVI